MIFVTVLLALPHASFHEVVELDALTRWSWRASSQAYRPPYEQQRMVSLQTRGPPSV